MLTAYSTNYTKQFQFLMARISNLPTTLWETNNSDDVTKRLVGLLMELKRLFGRTRKLLKDMGVKAGVAIEPDSQSSLCDATELIPGVLCAGVPGAGGVDAIFAVTTSQEARLRVEAMWSKWHENNDDGTVVCPLMLSAESDPKMSGINIDWTDVDLSPLPKDPPLERWR
jgi:phosphomevalonate kinase